MHERTTLPNGPRVISERLPTTRSLAVAVYVPAGSRSESLAQWGVAHFMEHLTFKGTQALPTTAGLLPALGLVSLLLLATGPAATSVASRTTNRLASVADAVNTTGAAWDLEDGSFTYTPAPNYKGADSFTYTASDGTATSSVAVVSISVAPDNKAPVANADSYTGDEDSILTGNVLSNDTDADGNTIEPKLPGLAVDGCGAPAFGTTVAGLARAISSGRAGRPDLHGPERKRYHVASAVRSVREGDEEARSRPASAS